jgi:hypothetical protein
MAVWLLGNWSKVPASQVNLLFRIHLYTIDIRITVVPGSLPYIVVNGSKPLVLLG